jgi:16S rRNA (cytosine1402-N4)-methyltransferase
LEPVVTGYHTPVLAEAVARLAHGRHRVLDGTVGGGGHAARFLAAGAEVLAVDRDPEALAAARARLGDERVTWRLGTFGDPEIWNAAAAFQPDFVLLDLGVSSHQLDADRRGFSFRPGVALDMRMGPSGRTAADLLNTADERTLRDLFREYGDERRAGALARAVVERRARAPLATSDDLVGAIRRALGPRAGPPDFARLFQAVRIRVNDELDTLRRTLPALRDALVPGGVLAVISYHSGEDRIVKNVFREWARACRCPAGQPVCTCEGRPLARRVTPRPVQPDPAEAAENPRARSARLRAVERMHGA